MTLTLQKISQRTARCPVEYMGDTANLEYYPAKVSIISQFRLNGIQDEATAAAKAALERGEDEQAAGRRVFAEYVCDVLAGWDLPEVEGGPLVPITIERLTDIDPSFLAECLLAIAQDSSPKSTRTPPQKPSSDTLPHRKVAGISSKKRG